MNRPVFVGSNGDDALRKSEPASTGQISALDDDVGHLRIRIEGDHPVDVPFSFERGRQRMPGAGAVSVVVHLLAVAVILLGLGYQARPRPAVENRAAVVPLAHDIVWLASAGPGGGGGGGGNGMAAPPRRAEMPGHDKITVPVAKPTPVVIAAQVVPRDQAPLPDVPQLDIAAFAMATGTQPAVGTLDGVPGGTSQGPGTGGGAGTGVGRGVGPGFGPGLGPGSGGGSGGGPVGPGSGVQNPQPIYQPKPEYTAEAMKAKIQGTVVIECIVTADGTVANPRISRSLDPRYGLDLQALKAAAKWRFIPARQHGQPVAMLVAIELTFALH